MTYDKINPDGNVAFTEHDHKYFNVKLPHLKYISVTTMIGSYYEKFNKEFFSRYKALERLADPFTFREMKPKMLAKKQWTNDYLKEAEVSLEEFEEALDTIIQEWDKTNKEACDFGTAYHLKKENEWYDNYDNLVKERLNVTGTFNCIKADFSLNREKVVIPEYLVYYNCEDFILNIAGQVDLLIKDGNDIHILDFKTNAKGIETKAYFNAKTKQTKKMLFPVNNLDDTTFNHYALQLSIYAYLLQQINPEFNICTLRLIHIDREEKETEYDVPYLKKEVELILAHFKKNLKQEHFKNDHKSLLL